MLRERMNANVKQDTMIYLVQIHFKAEFVQVKNKLLNSCGTYLEIDLFTHPAFHSFSNFSNNY